MVLVEAPWACTTLPEVIGAVRLAVARDHEVDVSVVGVVRPGELLRTSSGKIRRQACKQAYQSEELRLIARDDARQLPAS